MPDFVTLDDERPGLFSGDSPNLTEAEGMATYVLRFQDAAYDGNAPDAQFPTTRTLNAGVGGTYSVLAFQNNDPDAVDDATRLYIVPRAAITAGTGGALKVFGDPYFDGGSYRDFGLYFSADQGDTGHHAQGVFWLNSKVNGAPYTSKNPDIGFCFQDGATIAGRFAFLAASQPVLVVGPGKPGIAAAVPSAVRLEVQGDIGFDGTAGGKGIRWYRGSGNVDNLLQFNNSDLKLTLSGTQRLKVVNDGSLVMGDESAQIGTASTGGFLYLRSMAGTPSGTPVARAGTAALVYDTTANKLWAYNGSWRSVTFA